MSNWCWNNVEFTGEQKNIDNLSNLFEKTIDIQEKTGQGQLLFGIEGSIDGYMFEISNVDQGENYLILSFQSRWSPIPYDIVRIAELFNLQFTYSYDEGGMSLYGKYTFEINDGEGTLYDQSPNDDEIDECRFQEEGDDEDEKSGFDYEKLESLIESCKMEAQPITRIKDIVA